MLRFHPPASVLIAALALGTLGIGAATATPAARTAYGFQHIQYPAYPDRDYRNAGQRGDFDDRFRGRDPRGRIWRPGEQVPRPFIDRDRIVRDWEERGLQRPPGGHQWVRVGEQFLLVRFEDRRISRVINFY
jgi:Ni/Co efflux regulator RcnB